MNLLVTGGSGFIGSHVVLAAMRAGHCVRVLDLVDTSPSRAAGKTALAAVEVVVGDVRDPAACATALRDIDAVCHLAAKVGMDVSLQDLPLYASNNDVGTATLLAALENSDCGRLVLASSMVVYGEGAYRCTDDGPQLPAPRQIAELDAGRFEPGCPRCGRPLEPDVVQESAPLAPTSGYAATKVAQEHLASVWARATGGSAAMLRHHNVYGPGMPLGTPYAVSRRSSGRRWWKGDPHACSRTADSAATSFTCAMSLPPRSRRRPLRCSPAPPGRTTSAPEGSARCWRWRRR